jgi:hypothetical protein
MTDEDVKSLTKVYKDLPSDEKKKMIRSLINYYQFTESEEALHFIQEKYNNKDPVMLEALSIAKTFDIKIPLD